MVNYCKGLAVCQEFFNLYLHCSLKVLGNFYTSASLTGKYSDKRTI